MNFTIRIAETTEGILELRGNELVIIDKTTGDPIAIRGLSANGGIAKFSVCGLDNVEIGYLFFKRDERPGMGHLPIFEFWTSGTRDRDSRKLLEIRSDAIVPYVPLMAPVDPTPSSFLRSPNGRYEMEIQDDGNVVVYDEQNGHTPVSAFRVGFGL